MLQGPASLSQQVRFPRSGEVWKLLVIHAGKPRHLQCLHQTFSDISTLHWLLYIAVTSLHCTDSSTLLWLLYTAVTAALLLPLTALTAIAIDCSEPVLLPYPLSCYGPMPITVSQDTRTLLEEKWIWSIITHIILFNGEQINIMLWSVQVLSRLCFIDIEK